MDGIDNTVAIVIANDWPSNNGGGRIAVQNTVDQLLRAYSRVHFIGLVNRPFEHDPRWREKLVEWTHVSVIKQDPWKRFLKSLTSPLPAITMQFASKHIERQVLKILGNKYGNEEKQVLIFEDIHVACMLPTIKQVFPKMPMAIRSENLTVKAFESFCYKGHLVNKLAWRLEVSKIARFEKQICQMADRVWAITKDDAQGYADRLDVRCHGVFGVSLDVKRYIKIPSRDPFTVLYIGSTDLRKSIGLWRFINQVWKKVRLAVPMAKFLLAGNGTQQFTREDEGIFGLGYFDDEREFLGKGSIFINPQEDGSGIKLKSIVAMLSGKALVTTQVGIEGIVGQSGNHFLVAQDFEEMASYVIELMADPPRMKAMGRAARSVAAAEYNAEHLWQSARPLFEDLASLQK